VALPLLGVAGGWIIDTAGVRSFGLAHVDPDNVLHGFPELVDASADCPPNCDHTGTSGDCGLDKLAARSGPDSPDARRIASYRRLMESRSGVLDDWASEDVGETST
jgi:ribosome biogenesis GTPase